MVSLPKMVNSFKVLFLIFASLFCVAVIPLQGQDLDVPYVPTPQVVVDKMLELGDVQAGDYVIDLGSGDGRIVISAVKRGAVGHGIDLDPERIEEARENAKEQEVADRVIFLQQNIFETDFSRASVITMYLLNSVNQKLRPKLLEELEPGTRLVSHSFNMGDWEADKQVEVSPEESSRQHTIYYWVIPADFKGDWSWETGGQQFNLSADQTYQEPQLNASGGGSSWEVSKAAIQGKRLAFTLKNGSATHLYSGRIDGDSIVGFVQVLDGDEENITQWNASRE
jgi:SAM-dependent methyltransferase